MSKKQHDGEQYRQALGEYAYIHGSMEAAAVFKCSEDKARYWAKKFMDPTFHPQQHGGARNFKFQKQDERRCHGLIWALMKKKPDLDTGTLLRICSAAGFDLNETYIYRLFKLWGWTRKAPILKQFNKYSPDNIAYYLRFVTGLRVIDPRKIKYLDESHFISKVIETCEVVSPSGDNLIKINKRGIDTRYSLTLMLRLDNPITPYVIDLRDKSNSQWDFLSFVTYLCEDGHLTCGDYLIVDNATVHGGHDTYPILMAMLDSYGVVLYYLPTYSPELNPCEFIFSRIKNHMRQHRFDDAHFWMEILRAFLSEVNIDFVLSCYRHCIWIETAK